MNSTLPLYAGLIFLTAFTGGMLPLLVPRTRDDYLNIFVCLGAGLLLGMAFTHMIPEAAELLPHIFGVWVLLGFLLLLILERFVMVHPCEEQHCNYHTVGMAAFAGLAVHGVIEGFALASSVMVTNLGFLVLIAILAHKAPSGFALTSILRLAGKQTTSIVLFVLGVALSGPTGMFLAYFILKNNQVPASAGALLAISSGTFLYIAACDLLPELHRSDTEKFKRLGAFVLGLVLSLASGIFLK